MFKWVLVLLGLVTAVLLAAPQLVIIGLICLILPGLVLILLPTAFVYLLATSLIRIALPIRGEVLANVTAFALTLGLSAALMLPWRQYEQQKFAQAALPDILPADKLAIVGDILVDWPSYNVRDKGDISCDYLCVALLDTPGVTSVTRTDERRSATFRIGANNAGELVLPVEPQEIRQEFDKLLPRQHVHFEARKQADRELQAEWAVRIAQGEELRRDLPIDPRDIDWTIRFERVREEGQPWIERLLVLDRKGDVKVRKSLIRQFVPGSLFYFGFEGGSSADGFNGARFTVGGSTVSNQPRFYDLDGEVELLRSVDIPRPTPRPNSVAQAERTLLELLDDPNATPAQLLIAPMWLTQFRYDADKDQLDTIAKILADDRIADPAELLDKALSSRTDLTLLRAGLAKRFFVATEHKSQSWYIASLVGLPAGTFAQPTDDEKAIWSKAIEVQVAAPFLERMADRGPEAVPELIAILEASLEKPWHARRQVLEGICEAFKRLGPDAAAAVPRIRSLMEDLPSSLLNSYDDRFEWLVALNLMGVEPENLPFENTTLGPAELASDIQRVKKQARRYKDGK